MQDYMKLCEHLNNILKDRYDLDLLRGPIDHDHVVEVYEHYTQQRHNIRKVIGESAMSVSDDFCKAYLISETALSILREIAPKRINRKKGAK